LLALFSIWLTQPFVIKPTISGDRNLVDPFRLQDHVRQLSGDFYPRNYINLTNLNHAADYIRNEFEKTGGKVSEQVFHVNGSDYRNVRLELGEDESKGRIVIGAHYDSAFDTHGADDNASGVAGLIELANLIAKDHLRTKIELVAYSLEEPPFFGSEQMGSFVHAKSLSDNAMNVRLMVCLEMIGYYSDEPNSQDFPLIFGRLLYPTTGNFIALVGNFSNVLTVRNFKRSMESYGGTEVYSLSAPSFVTGIDLSDHRNYWRFGYDAVMVTDTAFFRNKAYHSVSDTADRLDYIRMAEVVGAVYKAVRDQAN
jgi:Zn-dependent M28 family amino/carboxypeptidase